MDIDSTSHHSEVQQSSPTKGALEHRLRGFSQPPPALSEIRHLLGPSWILEGEDPRIYEELLARVGDAVRPKDFIDWLMVADVVVLTCECNRLRPRVESILRLARRDAIVKFLKQAVPAPDPDSPFDGLGGPQRDEIADWATGWFSGDKKAIKYVNDLLAQCGLSPQDVTGLALSAAAPELNEIDSQKEALQRRRGEILAQIARRRAGLAKLVDSKSEEIIEAEYQELAAEPAGT
jgi:hypothetical protein